MKNLTISPKAGLPKGTYSSDVSSYNLVQIPNTRNTTVKLIDVIKVSATSSGSATILYDPKDAAIRQLVRQFNSK